MPNNYVFQNLTQFEANQRILLNGKNELPQAKKINFLARALNILKEPMLLLLVLGAVIYFIMGDLQEALMLSVSTFVVIAISIYQENKSENALAALKELSSPKALVVRDGIAIKITANLLVAGDLVLLHEGDRVPADGFILQVNHLNIDESLLTGENLAVKKSQIIESESTVDFSSLENKFKVFSSTLVVSGSAAIRIMNTGVKTEVGKIGVSLDESVPEAMYLNKEMGHMVKLFGWSGVIICIFIIFLYKLSDHTWVESFLVGLATQMSLLPEEFPVVLTIFMAMGAWRLSKLNVLIRKPHSIERLGATTILCVDKTGTLTENRMSVAALSNAQFFIAKTNNKFEDLAEDFHEVAEYGVLASHINPIDPMEKAIRQIVEKNQWGKDHLHHHWQLVQNYPLSDKLIAMSCVWKESNSSEHIIAAKGAPEAVIDLCHLDELTKQNALATTKAMAQQGLRVLGVAKAYFNENKLPSHQHDFNFQWVGLIGLEDPLRIEVPAAIELSKKAGIRVIMMTGDYPETALKIAASAGINTENSIITGAELKSLSDAELKEKLKTVHIFARVIPEQKLHIVKLLKEMGHVVAMTGDGVNDAPSLKWADIGIAMGLRGTDVAKEASDIVLLDDNFASIIAGIAHGRLIFTNIRKAMSYIVSIHIPIAGLSILPVILNWPLILLPVHIVFLELIIDPACSLMFESQKAEANNMSSPPRSLATKLFTARDLLRSSLQGLLILLIVTFAIWYNTLFSNFSAEKNRAFAFLILTLSNMSLIFADMSGGSIELLKSIFTKISNLLVVSSLMLALVLITQIEIIYKLFHFDRLNILEILISLATSLLVFIFISFWNRMSRNKN